MSWPRYVPISVPGSEVVQIMMVGPIPARVHSGVVNVKSSNVIRVEGPVGRVFEKHVLDEEVGGVVDMEKARAILGNSEIGDGAPPACTVAIYKPLMRARKCSSRHSL